MEKVNMTNLDMWDKLVSLYNHNGFESIVEGFLF